MLEFKEARRKFLANENKENYDKVVTQYCKTIDSKMEVNLIYLAKKLGISRDEIDQSQQKYLDKDVTLMLYSDEFLSVELPKDFNLEKAIEIQEEMAELSEYYQTSFGLGPQTTPQNDISIEFN